MLKSWKNIVNFQNDLKNEKKLKFFLSEIEHLPKKH